MSTPSEKKMLGKAHTYLSALQTMTEPLFRIDDILEPRHALVVRNAADRALEVAKMLYSIAGSLDGRSDVQGNNTTARESAAAGERDEGQGTTTASAYPGVVLMEVGSDATGKDNATFRSVQPPDIDIHWNTDAHPSLAGQAFGVRTGNTGPGFSVDQYNEILPVLLEVVDKVPLLTIYVRMDFLSTDEVDSFMTRMQVSPTELLDMLTQESGVVEMDFPQDVDGFELTQFTIDKITSVADPRVMDKMIRLSAADNDGSEASSLISAVNLLKAIARAYGQGETELFACPYKDQDSTQTIPLDAAREIFASSDAQENHQEPQTQAVRAARTHTQYYGARPANDGWRFPRG